MSDFQLPSFHFVWEPLTQGTNIPPPPPSPPTEPHTQTQSKSKSKSPTTQTTSFPATAQSQPPTNTHIPITPPADRDPLSKPPPSAHGLYISTQSSSSSPSPDPSRSQPSPASTGRPSQSASSPTHSHPSNAANNSIRRFLHRGLRHSLYLDPTSESRPVSTSGPQHHHHQEEYLRPDSRDKKRKRSSVWGRLFRHPADDQTTEGPPYPSSQKASPADPGGRILTPPTPAARKRSSFLNLHRLGMAGPAPHNPRDSIIEADEGQGRRQRARRDIATVDTMETRDVDTAVDHNHDRSPPPLLPQVNLSGSATLTGDLFQHIGREA